VPPLPGKDIPFAAGEKLEYRIDAFGATIGSFSMSLVPGRKPDALTIVARGRTESVAEDFYAVTAVAESHLGRALEDRAYDEDSTEDGVHRSVNVTFPPKAGALAVHATREGNPEELSLQAPVDTRDMLASLYDLRTIPLANGFSFCIPVFGARRIWLLRGSVTGRERITTPLGEYKTIHLSGTATRTEGPPNAREVHLWLTDDADRLPVAAYGMIQGKPVRVELSRRVPGGRRRR
jgi:hypothetical protein